MTESRYQEILQKWRNQGVPEPARELTDLARKPALDAINEILGKLHRTKAIDRSELLSESEKVGALLGLATWASFYIGVEYSSEVLGNDRPLRSQDSDNVVLHLDFEEWFVLEACVEAARQYIIRKPRVAKQSLSRQESDVVARIEDLQELVRKAGMASTEHLPLGKLETRLDQAQAFNRLLISTYASVEEAILDRMMGR